MPQDSIVLSRACYACCRIRCVSCRTRSIATQPNQLGPCDTKKTVSQHQMSQPCRDREKLCCDRLQFHTEMPLSRHKKSCRNTEPNPQCNTTVTTPKLCRDTKSPNFPKPCRDLKKPLLRHRVSQLYCDRKFFVAIENPRRSVVMGLPWHACTSRPSCLSTTIVSRHKIGSGQ